MKKHKRTNDEDDVLKHLRKAWNAWNRMEHKHPDSIGEFRHAIHTCQYLVGMRQISRVDKSWEPR
jgi:hypothetical protein